MPQRPRNDVPFNSGESQKAAAVSVQVFQQINGRENRRSSFNGLFSSLCCNLLSVCILMYSRDSLTYLEATHHLKEQR